MKNQFLGMVVAVLSSAALGAGCSAEMSEIDQAIAGEQAMAVIDTTATFSATEGLRFADDAAARGWTAVAPGVWRSASGAKQLIIGAEGHRWAVEQTEAELARLYEKGGDMAAIEHEEALLRMQQNALETAANGTQANCDIALYTGPASTLFGVIGGAALAQLSCTNGTLPFTVESQVCTDSTGCGPVHAYTAEPDSTPRLWGSVRSGLGFCESAVLVTPPGVVQSNRYLCD